DGLRQAIVGPAQTRSVGFESPELVTELVETTERAEGGLPLLQFALAELWDARDAERACITRAALQGIGGVTGALARQADRVMQEMLPAEREAARRLLLRLVTAEGLRVRRGTEDLRTADKAEAPALDALIRGRLLVVGELDGASV